MEGVIVGCDCNQEWLLPWWWEHFSKHNSCPVAFINFGMSQTAIAWCLERGQCISLPFDSYPLKAVSSQKKEQWEASAGSGIWHCRSAWFKKTLAFLHSPFSITCWIDLDCEIRGSLSPLFTCIAFGAEIALVRETEFIQAKDQRENNNFPDELTYNSGVVVFRKGAEILHHLAEFALNNNDEFMGDQNILSRMIYIHRPQLLELPPIYNWHRDRGINKDAVILHYASSWKAELLKSLYPDLFQKNQS